MFIDRERLKQEIESDSGTVQEFARQNGLGLKLLPGWLNGNAKVSEEYIESILNALGVGVSLEFVASKRDKDKRIDSVRENTQEDEQFYRSDE